MKIFEKPFNADDKTKIKEEYRRRLIEYRDNYLNDLPPNRLMLDDESYHQYKCRGNFWHRVAGIIDNLIYAEVIEDPETLAKVEKYRELVANHDFSKDTTKEDINKINKILDDMIEIIR